MKNTTTQEITVSTTLYASVNWLHTATSRLWRSRHSRGASSASASPCRAAPRVPRPRWSPRCWEGSVKEKKRWVGSRWACSGGSPGWSGRKGTSLWVVAGRCLGFARPGRLGGRALHWELAVGLLAGNSKPVLRGASWQQEHLCRPSPS